MKFSIITVNLNGDRYLSAALDSILIQDHPETEIIVVDGGSTDGSLATIQAYASGNPRIRWLSGRDRGIADAMNKGVEMARGEWTAFLHSDDYYPSADVISSVAAAVAGNPLALWLTGGMIQVDSCDRVLRTFRVRNYSYRWLKRSNILFHPATFVRTAVLRANPFDPELKLTMDYDLWLRLGALADPLLLDCTLAAFRVHAGSASSRDGAAALVEEYTVRRRFLKATGAWHFWYPFDYWAKRLVTAISTGP